MGLILTKGGSGDNFELIPPGSYIARCYLIADLGTQETNFQGVKDYKKQVLLSFEILDDDVKRSDGKPFTTSKTFTASLNEKSGLRKTLDGWRGVAFTEEQLKGFELSNVLGQYAQISIIHETSKDGQKTYANVSSIAPLHKSIARPAGVNEAVVFDMDDKQYVDNLVKLPEWLQKKIGASKEYNVGHNPDKWPKLSEKDPWDTALDGSEPF
jgi:hypothetical protein